MIECFMAACYTKGASNYICGECGEEKIFVCEGCEVELLNDLRGVGKVILACAGCAKTGKHVSDRAKEIRIAPLVKNAEKLRQALIDTQRFEESTLIRDLMVLVKDAYPYFNL